MSKKMNPEIKKLWVEALRSGDYKQGFGRLRSFDNEFCCLGVLCNIYAQQNPEQVKNQKDPRLLFGNAHLPPSKVIKWSGIPDWNPVVQDLNLSTWNDHERLTFKQIADLIEECL